MTLIKQKQEHNPKPNVPSEADTASSTATPPRVPDGGVRGIPADKPSRPEGPLVARVADQESVTLDWQPPADDGGSDVAGYFIEKFDSKKQTWTKVGGGGSPRRAGGGRRWMKVQIICVRCKLAVSVL